MCRNIIFIGITGWKVIDESNDTLKIGDNKVIKFGVNSVDHIYDLGTNLLRTTLAWEFPSISFQPKIFVLTLLTN